MSKLTDQYKSTIHQLVKKVMNLEQWRRDVTGNSPLFDIANEHTPSTLNQDQNNYDIGYYDVLRMSSNRSIVITGFQKGKKGRVLRIMNVGSYAIALGDESALSDAANRFSFATGTNNIIMPGSSMSLYYDSTQQRWIEGVQLEESGMAKETTKTISSNQNDYDPDDYGVLRLNPTANVTITGLQGGVQGRFLEFYNASQTYKITLADESASSSAANRIINSSGENTVLFPTARVRLYYDSTLARWTIPDPPSWKGTYGMATRLYLSSVGSLQTISTGVGGEKILVDSIVSVIGDEWGFFDAANNQIEIPTGMDGFYVGGVMGTWTAHATAGTQRKLAYQHNGVERGMTVPAVADRSMRQLCPISLICSAGDIIAFYATQESGGDLDLGSIFVDFSRIR